MMHFKKTVPYKLRRILPILGLAGASLLPACSKDDEPPHDITLEFYETLRYSYYSEIDSKEQLQAYAADKSIANIYLYVTEKNDYTFCDESNLASLHLYLKNRIKISPKIHGSGNFKLPVGMIHPVDSMWFVNNGWTINQHLQNQK